MPVPDDVVGEEVHVNTNSSADNYAYFHSMSEHFISKTDIADASPYNGENTYRDYDTWSVKWISFIAVK